MVEKGVTMPNYMWRAWRDEEMGAVLDLKPGVLVVLLYPRDLEPSAQKQRQLLKLVSECPSIRKVQLRPYHVRIPKLDPMDWAEECYRRAEPYLGPLAEGGIGVEMIPGNEMNLLDEGGHTDWTMHARWLGDFGRAYRLLDRTTRLHLPAWSPGGAGYQEGWRTLGRSQSLGEYFSVVDAHCYGGASERDYEILHDLMPSWPISVTELNSTDPYTFLSGLPAYVTDASWFILYGEEDQRLYFLMGSEAYASLKRYGDVGGGCWVLGAGGPTPNTQLPAPNSVGRIAVMTEDKTGKALAEQFPGLYEEWVAGGGVAHAFRAHLVAIGVLPVNKSELEELGERAETALHQLQAAVSRVEIGGPSPDP